MQICTRCVLPETFPGIRFDEEGVCNHCKRAERFSSTRAEKNEYMMRLHNMLEVDYDHLHTQVLMAYSGGKDSTYTMKLLKEQYGARIMAFTFDNGFISPQATDNIKRVCEALDIKHFVVQYDQYMLDTLFRYGAQHDMYPMKTMERASTICTICSGFFKSAAMMTALEGNIPLIGYGWSPGQAPIQSALTQANPKFVKMAQDNASKPIIDVLGQTAQRFFLKPEHYKIREECWPWSVHPLAFEEYNEEAIKEEIRSIGWEDPKDVDSNSTNCTLNAFANQVHLNRYGFHPYAQEIANMVRQGTMSREEGMEKIYTDQNPTLVNFAIESIKLVVE